MLRGISVQPWVPPNLDIFQEQYPQSQAMSDTINIAKPAKKRHQLWSGPLHDHYKKLQATYSVVWEDLVMKRILRVLYDRREHPPVIPPLFHAAERYLYNVWQLSLFSLDPSLERSWCSRCKSENGCLSEKEHHKGYEDVWDLQWWLKNQYLLGEVFSCISREQHLQKRYRAGLFREEQAKLVEFVLEALMKSLDRLLEDWRGNFLPKLQQYSQSERNHLVQRFKECLEEDCLEACYFLSRFMLSEKLRSERLELLLLRHLKEAELNSEFVHRFREVTGSQKKPQYTEIGFTKYGSGDYVPRVFYDESVKAFLDAVTMNPRVRYNGSLEEYVLVDMKDGIRVHYDENLMGFLCTTNEGQITDFIYVVGKMPSLKNLGTERHSVRS
ncbi:hypothetical protein BJ508DRAFT_372202 [Ascobolus immersus RN42]|uniref:Uncharacterized protein n=1 Tax=Ascobolus immersus RN42 TaxID=1160509 RepID=A0A3N4ILU2_ASCIM|nr:hypothetical protein BJ508DRAFT_372202 [Ascobolus immersus RN42]